MKIRIEFYNKKTEFIEKDFYVDVPKELVFESADSKDINYINAHMFYPNENLIAHIKNKFPEQKENFEKYDVDCIGREGLPEGY